MNDPFELTVFYQGQELILPAELRVYVYTHKIAVQVMGQEVLFEPDEERNYRATLTSSTGNAVLPDPELLTIIAAELEAGLK